MTNNYNGVPDYRSSLPGTSMPVGPYHVTSTVDPENHVATQIYNARGELAYVTEYTGTNPWARYATTAYGYDVSGNLVRVIDEDGNLTEMEYDALGRKKSMDDPDMGHWEYAYNAAGSLVEQFDANQNRLCFFYDELSRMTDKNKTSAGNCPPASVAKTSGDWLASYSYDSGSYGKGKLTRVEWSPGAGATNYETFAYDGLGRVTAQTRVIDGQPPYTMSTIAFDSLHRPTQMQYPDGEIVTVGYDREGENSLQAGSNMLVNDIRYNAHGQMTVLDRGSAAVPNSTYSYFGQNDAGGGGTGDSNFRLNSITHGSLLNFSYQYDTVGNITRIASGSDVQVFGYDHLNRLTSVSNAYNSSYTYDEIGNMTSKGGVTYNYTPPTQPHAVTSVGSDTFAYDDNGNMTTRNDTNGNYTQVFDVENRLTSLTSVVKGGGDTTVFIYDASGQRVMTVEPDGTTIYTPFPAYEKEVKGGTTIERSTYSLAGQAIATRVSGDPIAGNNGLFYIHSDHLGSTSAMSYGNGHAQEGQLVPNSITRYTPFGDYRTGGQSEITDRGFTGHKENRGIGLTYMNARYYVSGTGRFLSADTIVPDPASPQSFNRYSYVNNNPLKYTDPSGHYLCESVDNCNGPNPEPVPEPYPGLPDVDSDATLEFDAPFEIADAVITNRHNRNGHTGTDYAIDSGTQIYASTTGLVVIADWCSLAGCVNQEGNFSADVNGGFGNVMIVEYGYDGLTDAVRDEYGLQAGQSLYVLYGHLSSIRLWRGQIVQAGTLIGETGNSGNSTASHLHAEHRIGVSGQLWANALCTNTCGGADTPWSTWYGNGLTTQDPQEVWE